MTLTAISLLALAFFFLALAVLSAHLMVRNQWVCDELTKEVTRFYENPYWATNDCTLTESGEFLSYYPHYNTIVLKFWIRGDIKKFKLRPYPWEVGSSLRLVKQEV